MKRLEVTARIEVSANLITEFCIFVFFGACHIHAKYGMIMANIAAAFQAMMLGIVNYPVISQMLR